MSLGVRIGLELDTTGAATLVDGAQRRIRDWRPVFRGVVDRSVSRFFRDQFDTQGRHGGTPWAPLRPLTLKLRRRRGHGRGGIGRDSNRLWGSLAKVGPESVRRIEPQLYERGTAVPYADPFHRGVPAARQMVFGRRPKVPLGVPGRTLVPDPFPQPYVSEWELALARYITTGAVS